MKTITTETRFARQGDTEKLAFVHDNAWRATYRGIIPGSELEKMILKRGAAWWQQAIDKGNRIALILFGEEVVGYVNYGRNRAKGLNQEGEIYEIYLTPEYQGLGFGRKLFNAAIRDLRENGLKTCVVWVLSENEGAVAFFHSLGGKAIARSSERFGTKVLDKTAFAW